MFTKITRTKRLLVVIVLVVFVVLGVTSTAIFKSFGGYQTALKKKDLAEQIEIGVYERRLDANEYLLNFLDRARVQWFARQAQLEQLVANQGQIYQTPTEKSYIDAVRETLKESRETFQNIVATVDETLSNISPEVQAGKKERIAGELGIKAQQSIDAANQLLVLNNKAADRALTTIIVLFSIAGGVLAVVLAVCFWIIWRSATRLEQRQAEDEAILSSIGDGVFAIDNAGRIVLFNRTAEVLSGFSKQEALSKPYDSIFHFSSEKSGTKVEDFIKKSLAGHKATMAAQTLLKRKDGTMVPVADSAAPIWNNGDIHGAVIVFRDTTKEREVERMKDEFLSVASHELRTPMGAVRANISMILAGDYGPVNHDLVEPLNDMKTSTVRLVELVNDLLGVARLEAGRLKFSIQDYDIAQTIRQVTTSLAPLGREKGILVSAEHNESASVHGDPDKITQVLTNLVGNSLKFTDRGAVTVSTIPGAEMVTVEVADTGMGISLEDQKKLFGKFKQISSAQQGKPAGTGLGLYISREMIRKMGGELWIKQSRLGQGTVFAFTVPRTNSAQAAKAAAAIEQEAREHPDQK